MPFGLSNESFTFQPLVNAIFLENLGKLILVFFYDILIYSRSWSEHLDHVRIAFTILKDNQLVVKKKTYFAQR